MNTDLLPIRSAEPSAPKCANPHCAMRVTCRGEFCAQCEREQSLTRRALRARKERE